MLASSAGRELAWGLRTVSREIAAWQARAETIPDPAIRADALGSLVAKRSLVEGAGRFWSVTGRREPQLLRLLVAFQILANLLDTFSERDLVRSRSDPGGVMLAFVDAVDVERPLGDYYRDHPGSDDGGYLRALVGVCRDCCRSLPRYPEARALLARHADLAQSLDVHHDPDPEHRTRVLERFAASDLDDLAGATWFEQAAGASSALVVIALLTLAADERTTADDLAAAEAAYTWAAALSVMLDSYADQLDDAVTGHISFIAYYPDPQAAVARIEHLIDHCLRQVVALRGGRRHAVVVSMMVAMFLSRDAARSDALAADTTRLVRAGGRLTRLLVPILRFWRVSYGQGAE